MTLPQNVKDAVDAADEAAKIASNDSEGVAQWNLIRAHLLSQEAELKILRVKCSGTLANNLCPDHRDKQVGNPCLACTIEKLQSRLAAANERLETTERTLERCKQTLDTTSEGWRLDSERLEAAERDASVTKRSAETLCRIYFEIAAEAVGEDKVRAERDRRIHATQEGEG